MANLEITNFDNAGIIVGNAEFETGLLTLAGADDIAEGTILARDTTTNKFILYNPAGAGDETTAKAVLTEEVSSTGAGDVAVRPLVSGKVREDKILIDAGGTITNAIKDELRDYGIIVQTVTELLLQDTQD